MSIAGHWDYKSTWSRILSDDRLLMITAGSIVGICSGIAALALNRSLAAIFEWLHLFRHYAWAFIFPAVGAALSSLFLHNITKEGAAHGVPEVIYSVSRNGGELRFRSSFSRLIAAFLTIGFGGSAGPEAPVVMSGSSIGSNISSLFSLNERQRITLVGCGVAGAISSIFNAPISGIIFSIEIILGEWTALNIIPIAIASVAGAEVSRFFQGDQIPFSHHTFTIHLTDVAACLGLAVVTALSSILLTRMLRIMHRISNQVPLPAWILAAIGGCAVGIIGISFPVVLGEGYHFIREMIEDKFSAGFAVAAIALLTKILATSMTLGWGGSGGIFAPSLVIGSLSGLAYHRFLMLIWPSAASVGEGCFALLGMAGLISGILQAPLTGIFLIVEITGGYDVILPLIIVSAISSSICNYVEPASFYFKDLMEKGQLLRPGTDGRILSDLNVQELIETDCIPVTQNMLLEDFIAVIKRSHRNYFPVEHDQTGNFLGIIHLDDVRQYLFNPGMYRAILLEEIMDADVEVISPDNVLHEVLQKMDEKHLFSMPVVANEKFIGIISKATILDRYRKELMVQTFR